jgi:hypothetical protein
MFLGSRARPVRWADNLTAICEQVSSQCGMLNISQPYRPPRLFTWKALLLQQWKRIVPSFVMQQYSPLKVKRRFRVQHAKQEVSMQQAASTESFLLVRPGSLTQPMGTERLDPKFPSVSASHSLRLLPAP